MAVKTIVTAACWFPYLNSFVSVLISANSLFGPRLLERVWQQNRRILKSIVSSVLADRSAVEDVLQDAFTRILRSNRSFDSERDAYNFARRIVLNTTIDYYRWARRRHRYLQFAGDPETPSKCCLQADDPLDILIREEQRSLRHSLLREVQLVLGSLPPEQKQAIDLIFDRKGRQLKQLCEEMDLPYSTLRSRMLAGIDRIRKRLKSKGLFSNLEVNVR
ncbi:MAG: RNA polymerase sigma factor [Acidobacteriota bacterium]